MSVLGSARAVRFTAAPHLLTVQTAAWRTRPQGRFLRNQITMSASKSGSFENIDAACPAPLNIVNWLSLFADIPIIFLIEAAALVSSSLAAPKIRWANRRAALRQVDSSPLSSDRYSRSSRTRPYEGKCISSHV